MKYYAVTDDPNELLHYGVKGMKWGQHLFGDDLRPKSAGYKRALGKLRNSAKKAKTAKTATAKTVKSVSASLKKSATQRAINKQQKQEDKYNKAVAKAQQRINIVSNLSNVDKMRTYEKHLESDYKAQRNADKAAIKREHKYAKNERKMDKYTQLAREGRLKYGKLSEEQVGRITDRLSLERQARVLGNTEKPKFRVRAKEALQEGMLQGIVQGTAAGMKEVAVAKVQNRLANKHVLDKNSAQEAKRQKEASRIKNKKSTREIKQDFKQEAREEEIREGVGWLDRHNTFKGASRIQQQIQQKRLEDDRVRKLQSRIQDEMDLENNSAYQQMLEAKAERERVRRLNASISDEMDRYNNRPYQQMLADRDEQKYLNDERRGAVTAQRKALEQRAEKEYQFKMEQLKQDVKEQRDKIKEHEKAVKKQETAIADLKKNRDRMDSDKYDKQLRKMNAHLRNLRKNSPVMPAFEDLFRKA